MIRASQGGRGVDPVAVPAVLAQKGIDLAGIAAALARDRHVHGRKGLGVAGVRQDRLATAHVGALAAGVGRGEEVNVETVEIVLCEHPLHEHGPDHAPPPDDSDLHDLHSSSKYREPGNPQQRKLLRKWV